MITEIVITRGKGVRCAVARCPELASAPDSGASKLIYAFRQGVILGPGQTPRRPGRKQNPGWRTCWNGMPA